MAKHQYEKPNAAQLKALAKLAAMKDSDIDVSEVPEQLDWKGAKRGVFYN